MRNTVYCNKIGETQMKTLDKKFTGKYLNSITYLNFGYRIELITDNDSGFYTVVAHQGNSKRELIRTNRKSAAMETYLNNIRIVNLKINQ
jgi:hypothetical protein